MAFDFFAEENGVFMVAEQSETALSIIYIYIRNIGTKVEEYILKKNSLFYFSA